MTSAVKCCNALKINYINVLDVFGVTRIYKGSNPSLVKVLGPNWDQNLFLAPKISYLCRKEFLSYEINVFP